MAKSKATTPESEARNLEWIGGTLLSPESADADNSQELTRDVEWYTGATVPRMDFRTGQRYMLTLSMKPGDCDLSRLNSGAPMLDTHQDYDLSSVIGVVVDGTARIENGIGKAKVKFSQRPELAGLRADVRAGIIRNISVGTSIGTLKDVTPDDSKMKFFLATSWQPGEISAVPIGADAGAGFLSQQVIEPTVEGLATAKSKETNMDEKEVARLAEVARLKAIEDSNEVGRLAGVATERNRVTAINAKLMPQVARLGADFIAKVIADGNTVEQSQALAFDKLATVTQENATQGQVSITQDAGAKLAISIENTILHRVAPDKHKLEAGREYRGMSLLEIGRFMLERSGVKTSGMSRNDLAGAMLVNSNSGRRFVEFASGYTSAADFPSILANVANKTLRAAYDAEPQTFKAFTKRGTIVDFKPASRTQIGDVQTLQPLGENGEFKRSKVTDNKETIQLGTYGEIFALGRVAMINDDLGAFNRLAESHGRAAARLESDMVWGIITNGTSTAAPYAMNDTYALFDSSHHANYTSSGTAITVASLNVATAAMRNQKGLNSVGFLNLMPKYTIVPVALDSVAKQYVAATNIIYTKASDFNPYNNTMQVISEPRLDVASATGWYLAADPGQIDTIEYAYLEGQEGVYMETRNGFEIDGIEIKARLDFGCKTIDYRGLYKNAGA